MKLKLKAGKSSKAVAKAAPSVAKRTDKPVATRSGGKLGPTTGPQGVKTSWNVIWASYLDGIASGATTEELLAAHPEWCITSSSTLHRKIGASEELWSDYLKARRAGLIGISESILQIADDGTNDWQEKEGRGGRTYQSPNNENVQRSRLRVDSRLKLLAAFEPAVFGNKIDVSNKDGSFANAWATALGIVNTAEKMETKH